MAPNKSQSGSSRAELLKGLQLDGRDRELNHSSLSSKLISIGLIVGLGAAWFFYSQDLNTSAVEVMSMVIDTRVITAKLAP